MFKRSKQPDATQEEVEEAEEVEQMLVVSLVIVPEQILVVARVDFLSCKKVHHQDRMCMLTEVLDPPILVLVFKLEIGRC